jgi:hypothetical protein
MDLENTKDKQTESQPLVSVRGRQRRSTSRGWVMGCVLLALLLGIAGGLGVGLGVGLGRKSSSSSSSSTARLVDGIKTSNLMTHLRELQSIADQTTQHSRAVQYGYNQSAEYVITVLEENGYEPEKQYFTVPVYSQVNPSTFTASVPGVDFDWTFLEGAEYALMTYSGSGKVTNVSLITVEDGCSSDDFSDVTPGDVVLLNYTTTNEDCSLYDRAVNAKQAEAGAAIMMRQEDDVNARFPPTSRVYVQNSTGIFTVDLPLLGASYQLGQKLLNLISLANGDLTVAIETATSVTEHDTYNVLAYTSAGRNSSIIVSGTHLDSVPAGPGINDNGSGSSANLEMAIQLAKLGLSLQNKVLFAWWGAEELGLFGSTHFVLNLDEEELPNFACDLNFDMIGSPNYARMIYNGSQAEESIRDASVIIQGLFGERFKSQGLEYELTDFTGRSDYGPFIANGIPAGGLFTGAEVRKTEEQQKVYGGLANAALDPCYHQV